MSKRAKVALGSERIDRSGSFTQPTILTDIKPESLALRDDFWGPVAMVFRVKGGDAAVTLANDVRSEKTREYHRHHSQNE